MPGLGVPPRLSNSSVLLRFLLRLTPERSSSSSVWPSAVCSGDGSSRASFEVGSWERPVPPGLGLCIGRPALIAPPAAAWTTSGGFQAFSPSAAAKVQMGSATRKQSAAFIQMSLAHKVPIMIEQPFDSFMWDAPPVQALRRDPACRTAILDQCGIGTRSCKHTKLAVWNCGDLSGLRRVGSLGTESSAGDSQLIYSP